MSPSSRVVTFTIITLLLTRLAGLTAIASFLGCFALVASPDDTLTVLRLHRPSRHCEAVVAFNMSCDRTNAEFDVCAKAAQCGE